MQVKIDFNLSRRFGAAERIIFGLVMRGFSNAREIFLALPLFSDAVIANAIRNLVNQQILSADIETGTLSLSEPVVAIIDMCLERSFDVEIPESLSENITHDGILLQVEGWMPEELQREVVHTKEAILREMLPDVKLDLYRYTFDFVIRQGRGEVDE